MVSVSSVSAPSWFSSPVKRKMTEHQNEGLAYAALFLGAFAIWMLVSTGEFSFAMTLGSLAGSFSFVMLAVCLKKSAAGLSLRGLECYALVTAARCFAVVPHEGYLPFDASGDWFYQCSELTALLTCCYLIYQLRWGAHVKEYKPEFDSFKIWRFLVLPCICIAMVLHSELNQDMPSDIMWAFALNLESVAGLPQLFFFQREQKVHRWSAHFLFLQGVSKLLNFSFWAGTYSELNVDDHHTKQFSGPWCLIVQAWQLLLMGDFFMEYAKCMSNGTDMTHMLSEV